MRNWCTVPFDRALRTSQMMEEKKGGDGAKVLTTSCNLVDTRLKYQASLDELREDVVDLNDEDLSLVFRSRVAEQ